MASFMQDIKSKYDMKTYEGTKDTYDWIVKVINQIDKSKKEINANFLFKIGKITCSCKGVDEFIEHAYGYDGFDLIRMQIMKYHELDQNICVICSDSDNVHISTTDKVTLEKIVQLLEETDIKSKNEITQNINVQNNYKIESINGDNNTIVQGTENKVTVNKEEKQESKLKTWTEAIFQNLLANWIWLVIPLIFGVIASVLTK